MSTGKSGLFGGSDILVRNRVLAEAARAVEAAGDLSLADVSLAQRRQREMEGSPELRRARLLADAYLVAIMHRIAYNSPPSELRCGSSAGGVWTAENGRRTLGWRCECSCGWAGPVYDSRGPQSPSDEEADVMMDRHWDAGHAQPLLVLAELRALARRADEAAAGLRAGVGRQDGGRQPPGGVGALRQG